MPVPIHNSRPVPRPSGQLPPGVDLTGVTELRLHGVGGIRPETLLADLAPQLVAGDQAAGFYRTADLNGRHVEAYSWGALAVRSAVRLLWLLLLPFAMVNVAGWMCTPATWRSRWRFLLHRAVLRVAALAMTLNLVLLAAMTAMDVMAYQCGARDTCVDHWWLRWLRWGPLADHPGWRVLAGAAIPLLLVLGLALLGGRQWTPYESVQPPRGVGDASRPPLVTSARPGVGLGHPYFWHGKSIGLGVLHLAVAMAFLAWLTGHTVGAAVREAGQVAHSPGWHTATVLAALVTLIGAVVLLASDRPPVRLLWPFALLAVLLSGMLSAGCAAVFAMRQPLGPGGTGPLPGMSTAVDGCYGVLVAVVLAVLVSGLVTRRRGEGPRALLLPFAAVAAGGVLLNGVGTGVMIRVADLLGDVPHPAARPDRSNALMIHDRVYALVPYLTLLPLAVLAGLAVVGGLAWWRGGGRRARRAVRDEYGAMSADVNDWSINAADTGLSTLRRSWEARIARARWAARVDAGTAFVTVTLALLVGLAYGALDIWVYHRTPPTPLLATSTFLATAAPLGLLLLVRRGWQGLDSRRRLGIVWDVSTFWPRAYHPLAPPPYTARAVPDLQRRLWRLHDAGGRAVVVAHSQGSVIALAALLQESHRPAHDQVALVTFGCPFRKLYGSIFPAYFGDGVIGAGRPRVWRWRNFFYDTDPVGGPVQRGDCLDGVDERLPDPDTPWYDYGSEPPRPRGHGGYWTDPRVWALVNHYAFELT
ncbi:hypothetical protein EV384_4433 [Micromonospora kangleipakensis]|uniref:Integral membrane protein n=1 Tax=Micromonospora kangleipakensis TaxID=1077942 RepID=A0A4Q8BDA9_9ACTN|nr:hypothetical protein [Micromonospora kangleipakensis]RZU75862.1 hypothetical protein EV384_4433 [Micromonospora kangleipakensis]